jgi:hypothetical protein
MDEMSEMLQLSKILDQVWWLSPIILATWEAEIRRTVQGQSGEKVCETWSQPWQGTMVCACHPSYSGKYKQEDCNPGQLGHKARPYLKNNQYKQSAGGSRL